MTSAGIRSNRIGMGLGTASLESAALDRPVVETSDKTQGALQIEWYPFALALVFGVVGLFIAFKEVPQPTDFPGGIACIFLTAIRGILAFSFLGTSALLVLAGTFVSLWRTRAE